MIAIAMGMTVRAGEGGCGEERTREIRCPLGQAAAVRQGRQPLNATSPARTERSELATNWSGRWVAVLVMAAMRFQTEPATIN